VQSKFLNIAIQIIPGLLLGISAFQIGIFMVIHWNWHPVVAALPLYPAFAFLMAVYFKNVFNWSGYGLNLNGLLFGKFLKHHLIAFLIANTLYLTLLFIFPSVDFQLLALPPLTLTLVISGWLNKVYLPITESADV
jgi:hypothetical protein